MSYVSKEWITGETITADGLNNIEEGVQEALECCGGGAEQPIFVVNVTDPIEGEGDPTSDKTYAEIYEAYEAEKLIICRVHSQLPGPGGPVALKELPMAYNGLGFPYFYTYTSYIEDLNSQLVCLRVRISASDSVNVSYESYVLTPAS